jgi:hypothetical protein
MRDRGQERRNGERPAAVSSAMRIPPVDRRRVMRPRRAAPALLPLLLLLLLTVAACTPMQWQHPLYGTTRAQADLTDCDHIALQEAWRYPAFSPFMTVPHVHHLPNGQVIVDPTPNYAYDPYYNTPQLRNFCMRSKGYELVPAPRS